MPAQTIAILGVHVHPLTVDELHQCLADVIDQRRRALAFYVNVHGLNLAVDNPWLRDTWNEAEIVFCDGAGVILGARLLGHHIPERITGADWLWQLAEFANNRGYSLYFLGAQPGNAQTAADRLLERLPDLKIVGVQHGYFNKTRGHPENEAVVHDINRCQPNILVVGMGMPLQEQWLRDNWQDLKVNVALTTGAAFDYLSGQVQRAPLWMNDHSLEWLGRLLIEPRRLWRRYVLGNPIFLARILEERLFGRH
ncbi:Glycosyl transferase, WecB/TagA/CpsF family [Candidatus Promineifilum breve]|uniref:Glycosyl transferase, WecB/TagA/CpsF family n=1 Tax=Candidatus Promineifilum breve TaxID=1806508 RepID=A0A160T6W3_9CHLR|nr:WecB/TagA/CpsF family glycosyltransferase [Candidatus Promineifilum breve]CUS05028.2 Glycosyl transferase, WecB/TagA/CpsF family [Candidatus Promineifilum breve]